jgi:murein L,D-transpeptidase YcbB/YkuD
MPITPEQVRWGSYLQYSGPYWHGSIPYVLPATPRWEDKLLWVVSRTEGGALDAVNMYDRMIATVGAIQWGEAGMYGVSDMLGVVAERDLSWIANVLGPAMAASGAEFRKTARGKWRFHFQDARGEVDRIPEQQQLFLDQSDGMMWDDASKAHARLWAACLANVWESPTAQRAQVDFTAPRMMGFLMKEARALLFGPGSPPDNEGLAGALRAGYISFAANLPAVASKHLLIGASGSKAQPWSKTWCIDVLRQLTFGPEIAIYPGRYNKIRPALESLFGVDLPDFAAELQTWQDGLPEVPKGLTLLDFDEVEEYQRALIAEGYDIGPSGADGKMGAKTKAAIVQFQRRCGLVPDGIVGLRTRQAFLDAALKRAA